MEVTWAALFTIAWRMLRKATQRDAQGGRKRRARYDSRRSVSSFVSEQEYMRQHGDTLELRYASVKSSNISRRCGVYCSV